MQPETDKTLHTEGNSQFQGIGIAENVTIGVFNVYARPADAPSPSTDDALPAPPNPYPGLTYFGPGDSARFFGREAAIQRLAAAVNRQSFTALVGASGTGKSSVVLAGLAPHLKQFSEWHFSYFRIGIEPDKDPFRALAGALVAFYVDSATETAQITNTNELAQGLKAGTINLRNVFAACRQRTNGRPILLVADQFEEAFTLIPDTTLRHQFIDTLLAGFRDPQPGAASDICLILTLRADFYGSALQYRRLADALQGHVENLGPMKREELKEAILRPALAAGVSFETGLVETLIEQIHSETGGLPLLQFALREMWLRQRDRKITRASYDEIGGIEGALSRRAEDIFRALTKAEENPGMEQIFQRLFTRLVTPGEGHVDTRRVVDRRELGEELWKLAQRLASEDNRLVVTNSAVLDTRDFVKLQQTAASENPLIKSFAHETVEVTHEALIRHWPKLKEWIDQDRAFLSWLKQIRVYLELWVLEPNDEGLLLRGGVLAQAADWLRDRGADLSQSEREYIKASIDFYANLEKDRLRRARLFGFGGIVVALIAMLLSGAALYEYIQAKAALKTAIHEKNIADSNLFLANQNLTLANSTLSLLVNVISDLNDPDLDIVSQTQNIDQIIGFAANFVKSDPLDASTLYLAAAERERHSADAGAGYLDRAVLILAKLKKAEPTDSLIEINIDRAEFDRGWILASIGEPLAAGSDYQLGIESLQEILSAQNSSKSPRRLVMMLGDAQGDYGSLILSSASSEKTSAARTEDILKAETLISSAGSTFQHFLINNPSDQEALAQLAWVNNKLGDLQLAQHDDQKSYKFYEQAGSMLAALQGSLHSNPVWQQHVAVIYMNLGLIDLDEAKFSDALTEFTQAKAFFLNLPDDSGFQSDVGWAYDCIGTTYYFSYLFDADRPVHGPSSSDALEKAMDALDEAQDIRSRLSRQASHRVRWAKDLAHTEATRYAVLGQRAMDAEHYSEANDDLTKASQLTNQIILDNDWEPLRLAEFDDRLAETQMHLAQLNEAKKTLQIALTVLQPSGCAETGTNGNCASIEPLGKMILKQVVTNLSHARA